MSAVLDLVRCEALTCLCIHHLTPQPTTNRLLHSSLVLLKVEIAHILVDSYQAVGFLLVIDNVLTIVGSDWSGSQASICSKATQD